MTDKLVHSRIEEIRARLAAATPRPWRKSGHSSWTVVGPNDVPEKHWMMPGVTLDNFDRRADERVCSIYGPGNGNHASADFDFIVNAPADIAWLLDALDDEHIVAEDRLQTLNVARATPKDEARRDVTDREVARAEATYLHSNTYRETRAEALRAVLEEFASRRAPKDEAAPTPADKARVYAATLHELIRPDNGYCNQCGGHWLFRLNGTWDYLEGEHLPTCIGRRMVEAEISRRDEAAPTVTDEDVDALLAATYPSDDVAEHMHRTAARRALEEFAAKATTMTTGQASKE